MRTRLIDVRTRRYAPVQLIVYCSEKRDIQVVVQKSVAFGF